MGLRNIADHLLSVGADGDVAVIETDVATSYGQLRQAAARIGAALRDLSLPEGSRVGILGPNSRFWIAGYLATLKLNLVAVPFAAVLTPADVRRNADLAGISAVLVDRRARRTLARAFDSPPPVVTDEVLADDGDGYWPDLVTDPDSDAALMFTSGTTSLPRAVRVTHRNIAANTESIVEYLGLDASDRMLVVLPFSYCYGASLLHTHLRVGGSVALCSTFTFPETAVEMAESTGCTGFAGVPSSLQLLLRASSFGTRPLAGLRTIQQAGGKLPPAQLEQVIAAQPQARVFVMYGQTEATARLSYLPPERLADKLGSIGRGIPGVELRVLDAAGQPVAPGEVGEIVARGANISPGYLDDPEATAAKFPGGELRTGDLGTVDDDGFVFVLDRKDDFIKTWGYRVSSQEVEAAALQLPDLVTAAVVGVPDERAGESIALFATQRAGTQLTATQLVEHLRGRLAKHMIPEHVHLVDALPLNSNGKVVKSELRAWAVSR